MKWIVFVLNLCRVCFRSNAFKLIRNEESRCDPFSVDYWCSVSLTGSWLSDSFSRLVTWDTLFSSPTDALVSQGRWETHGPDMCVRDTHSTRFSAYTVVKRATPFQMQLHLSFFDISLESITHCCEETDYFYIMCAVFLSYYWCVQR